MANKYPGFGYSGFSQAPCSSADIQRVLGDAGIEVTCCCVLYNFETDDYEAYAVVNRGGGRELIVDGWSVFLLPTDAPLSLQLRGRLPGDVLGDLPTGSLFPEIADASFLCYQVVSVDGSPILSETERERSYQEGHEEVLHWNH